MHCFAKLVSNTSRFRGFLSSSNVLGLNSNSSLCDRRYLSQQDVTRNLKLFAEEPRKFANKDSLKLVQPTNSKSLVLMFSWLQPNPKPLEQFSAFYVNLGFDVLVVTVEMMQLLRPVHGTHLIAGDILKFMATNESYKSILLHGFSVGGYMWGECLVQINDNAPKYEPLVNRIKGQVWDSMTGSKEISVGQARAITKNLFVQKAVVQFSNFYLRALHNVSTKHYLKAENIFNEKALVVPALLFFSKTDPIGTEQKSLNIIKALEALNIKVTQKCFEDSPHVGHFKKYKEEYTTALIEHLKLCNLIT